MLPRTFLADRMLVARTADGADPRVGRASHAEGGRGGTAALLGLQGTRLRPTPTFKWHQQTQVISIFQKNEVNVVCSSHRSRFRNIWRGPEAWRLLFGFTLLKITGENHRLVSGVHTFISKGAF